MLIGYARVSTTDQDPQLQIDALRAAGVERMFTDQASGTATSRPEFDKMLGQLRLGDTLVVWRLDRLGRSMKHLLELADELERSEVNPTILNEQLGTTTANGRLIFHVMAALAEFEGAAVGADSGRLARRPAERPRWVADRRLSQMRRDGRRLIFGTRARP